MKDGGVLFFGKKSTFCQILQKAVSDYQTLISFGLILGVWTMPSIICKMNSIYQNFLLQCQGHNEN